MLNWLREWRHLFLCGAERYWIPRGGDAVCSECGYRVKGGGREARVSQALRGADVVERPPVLVRGSERITLGPCLACKNAMEQGEQCQACGYVEPGLPAGGRSA